MIMQIISQYLMSIIILKQLLNQFCIKQKFFCKLKILALMMENRNETL